MKKLLFVSLFALFSMISFAQNGFIDVVYLKNGTIVKGMIIEQIPKKSLKIKTADERVFSYEINEVEKFTKEPLVEEAGSVSNGAGLKKGYTFIGEFGYQKGPKEGEMKRLQFDVINAYQINPYFSAGVGLGLRYYLYDQEMRLCPVFVDLRGYFSDRAITPYLGMSVGYTFWVNRDFEQVGWMLHPSLGFSFKVCDGARLNVSLGYENQSFIYYYNNGGSLSLGVGILF